ncbi:hypothetical protein BGZ83_005114 [Gryganskiella cystojenkinii]|nr:hypothetical protein BGZ83_005114 [Gryganskiella cystojenkinii]
MDYSNSPGSSSSPRPQPGTGSGSGVAGSGTAASSSSSSILGSIVSSAKIMTSALDPRQAPTLTQHGTFGSGSSSSNNSNGFGGSSSTSGFLGGSSSKNTAGSSSTRTFQHVSNAIETIGSSSSNSATGSSQGYQGFRQPASSSSFSAAGGMMDWDSFLGSSESTIAEDRPYQPPTYSFESLNLTEPEVDLQHQGHHPPLSLSSEQTHTPIPTRQQLFQQGPLINLTPANHAAFLQYLRSTASNPALQAQPSERHFPHTSAAPLQSRDVLCQQQQDGGDVLNFLNSTSYADFVDSIESAGLEKHQEERREFVYDEGNVHGPSDRNSGRLASLLSLIQNLPSERQDVVQYLLQQGTYSDDIWSRPFGHDAQREEAASMAATLAEQDHYLKEQQRKAVEGNGSRGIEDADDAEMERVLQQIVDDAKKEVGTGETQGKALDRLLMVRKHLAKL